MPNPRTAAYWNVVERLMREFIWCGGILYQRRTLLEELRADFPDLREPFGPAWLATSREALDVSGERVTLPAYLTVAVAPHAHRIMGAEEATDWIAAHRWTPHVRTSTDQRAHMEEQPTDG